jgi:hypothetical protein
MINSQMLFRRSCQFVVCFIKVEGGSEAKNATGCNLYGKCTDPAVSTNCSRLTKAIATVTPYQ